MCGIAGFSINTAADPADIFSADWLAILGVEMMTRGRDATGVLTVSRKGRLRIAKATQKADEFFSQRFGIGDKATTAIVHTRFATQGAKENHLNNHPVAWKGTIGIHNGMIDNDHTLFAKHGWERYGEVDSEVIFAAIDNLGYKEALETVEGSLAIAWVDAIDPDLLWLARGDSSPLFVCEFSNALFFASTWAALDRFRPEKNKPEIRSVKEGTILQVRSGKIINEESFKPAEGWKRNWAKSSNAGSSLGTLFGGDDYEKFDYGNGSYAFRRKSNRDYTAGSDGIRIDKGDRVKMATEPLYGTVTEIDPKTGVAIVDWDQCEIDCVDLTYRGHTGWGATKEGIDEALEAWAEQILADGGTIDDVLDMEEDAIHALTTGVEFA